jgi:hypothetical protein
MESINDILKAWGEEKQKALIANYKAKGLKASGNFERNITQTVQDNTLEISAPTYTWYMVHGRGVTKGGGGGGQSLRSIIRKWIDDKGIRPKDNISLDSLAYLITRKIHNEGIKVPSSYNDGRLLKDTFTPQSISELTKKIGNFYVTDITSNIQNAWQQQ